MLYDLGPRLVKLRREANMTQQELVDRTKAMDPTLHLTDSVLGKYENDKSIPRLAEAAAIADVMNVSLDYLASGEKNQHWAVKGLTDEQIEVLFRLAALFRQTNRAEFHAAESSSFTSAQAELIFRIMALLIHEKST